MMLVDYIGRLTIWLKTRENERGQTLVEYALVITLVSIALIGALQLLTGALDGVFGKITSTLNGVAS